MRYHLLINLNQVHILPAFEFDVRGQFLPHNLGRKKYVALGSCMINRATEIGFSYPRKDATDPH